MLIYTQLSTFLRLGSHIVSRDGNIGFLKTKNRINVMLSRARHGMYILGHPATLLAKARSTDMWPQVRSIRNLP